MIHISIFNCIFLFQAAGGISEGFPATPTIEVLGVTLGSGPRKKSQAEVQRATKVKRMSKRLSVLPVSQAFKSTLAATVMAPLAVWGALLNGRVPTKDENARFLSAVLSAVSISLWQSGGGSTSLRQCLLLGHSSDLRFLAAQRLLMAIQKWRSSRGVDISQQSTPVLSALKQCMLSLDCTMVHSGSWSHSQGTWDTAASVGFAGRLAHCFRQHWRFNKINAWLCSERRDARLAREQGLRPTTTLIDSLRQSAKQLSAWELGVICGGFHSDMQVHPSCQPSRCPYCHQDEIPGTMHILWSCPCWAHLRVCAQPQNPFLARMGWDQNGINQKLIQQFGAIRREHASAKRLLLLAPKPGGSPGGRGGPLPEDCVLGLCAATAELRCSADDDDAAGGILCCALALPI